MQRFLILINFYRRFINKYAEIRQQFNKLLKQNVPWEYTLSYKQIQNLYDPKLPLYLFVDASKVAEGVLKQPDKIFFFKIYY